MTDEHPRMTSAEVCALARYGKATLWRRIDAAHMPAPVDRGSGGFLFDRREVLKALGLEHAVPVPPAKNEPTWKVDPVGFREYCARKVRRR